MLEPGRAGRAAGDKPLPYLSARLRRSAVRITRSI